MPAHEYETTLEAKGPWSFSESVRFLEGFAPAAVVPTGETMLRLAFVPDGQEKAAGVSILPTDSHDDQVTIRVVGSDEPELVVDQVRRILSLNHDGSRVPDVARRDPVIGKLWKARNFLRPVLFNSPYEAAAWAIIGNRIRIRQAAKIKTEMARTLGTVIGFEGATEHAFPAPHLLAQLPDFPGLTERKVTWLRGIGEAAMDGLLHASRLRSMPADDAFAALCELKGIGPFGAELILLRGAGEADRIPANEGRFGRAVELAYQLDAPPAPDTVGQMAEAWSPYRTWVAVLLRAALEDRTQEITNG